MKTLIIADLVVLVLAILLNVAHAQTAVDLSVLALDKPGTQTLISLDDTFSMSGKSYITNLPPCPASQQWHEYRADPARPGFVPQYVVTGAPSGYRFNYRDPVNGNYITHGNAELVCE